LAGRRSVSGSVCRSCSWYALTEQPGFQDAINAFATENIIPPELEDMIIMTNGL
jgi:hypothetical protein